MGWIWTHPIAFGPKHHLPLKFDGNELIPLLLDLKTTFFSHGMAMDSSNCTRHKNHLPPLHGMAIDYFEVDCKTQMQKSLPIEKWQKKKSNKKKSLNKAFLGLVVPDKKWICTYPPHPGEFLTSVSPWSDLLQSLASAKETSCCLLKNLNLQDTN